MSDNISKFQKNAELIFTYIYNNRMIIISIFVLIIVIIAGILIYNANIESKDKMVNAEFESAFALYGMLQNNRIPKEQLNDPTIIVEITTKLQKVYFKIKSGLFFGRGLLRYRKLYGSGKIF